MQSPKQVLEQRVADALRAAYPDIAAEGELVVPTQSAEHGDYQCNRALQMAKAAKSNPRAVAQAVVGALQVADMCSAVEIAGPGFINFRLSPEWLGNAVAARLADERLGVARAVPVRTYVVDFSSPNVAKPMHVGHIRSTVLGDVLVRVLRFLGHDVVGDNHLGDWGTQFGMMILGYRDYVDQDALARDPIGELKRIYQAVVERAKTDEAYAEKARAELAKLQAGDPENLALWQEFIALSRQVFERIYRRLDISFDCWHGESFYNDMLAGVVQDLLDKGIARHDQGAAVIFFEAAEELRDKPFIIQKKDGAYLYSSSDLAAIKFRTESMHPDAMIYVVDGRQQLHFKQLFAAARLWGYRDVELQHVWFGTIMGADNRPIKTREGEPPELSALLDEAEERALAIVREKQPDMAEAQLREVARVVGIGAVKYGDLSQNRTSDYVFSWDKMLSMQGNSAPYLMYAYARVNSILEKAGVSGASLEENPPRVILTEPSELSLAKKLLQFSDAVHNVLDGYRPNVLCTYTFELAGELSSFLEECRVLDSPPEVRASRLALVHQTGRTLKHSLALLGIQTLPRM